jgi:LPPG:FO 2-phospho-L-lactate transferase
LTICPDLDTVLYNLANLHNPETGWGRRQESFTTLETIGQLGGEDWFRLGDKDLALHLRRTEWLRQGHSLTIVSERLRLSLGVPSQILPMCNEPVRTLVHTDEGDLPFQHYFVRRRCEPIVIDLSFVGAAEATLSPEVAEALHQAELIVICPSNPYLSIDPILSVPGMHQSIRKSLAPKVAISPIISGRAIKGPAAKLMSEMGKAVNASVVAEHYVNLLDGFIIDQQDADLLGSLAVRAQACDTLMVDAGSRARVAQATLDFGAKLLRPKQKRSKSAVSKT